MTNTATTYAESQRRLPFDWRDFLRRAQAGETTEQELACAVYLASGWTTCACGNQCAAIPRNSLEEPQDILLSDFGMQFYDDISAADWGSALETLDRIEKRSAEILATL